VPSPFSAHHTWRHSTAAKLQAKPVTMRQVALEAQLNPSRSPSPEPLTHVQEQATLRKETISAFHTAINDDASSADDNDSDDELLVPREKTKDEREVEEKEYRAFLEREVGDLKEIIGIEEEETVKEQDGIDEGAGKKKKKKASKDDKSTKKERTTKEEEDQEFLMRYRNELTFLRSKHSHSALPTSSYILNRGWIDKSKNHIPTYSEITSKKKSSKRNHASQSDSEGPTALDDDDRQSNSSFESLIDHFESSYNHRFEEPGSSVIPSYPRTLSTLVRREDTKRKEARERKKSRRQDELDQKKEEVRRLKALKMREIRRKLEKVGIEGGLIKNTVQGGLDADNGGGDDEGMEMDDALKNLDLEGDWDPEKHDQQMAGLYGGIDEYDEGEHWEDVDQADEEGKPVWEDDIDIGDIYVPDDDAVPAPGSSKKDKKKKKKKKKKDGVEPQDTGVDVDAMDADVQPHEAEEEEEWDGTEEMRKRKWDEYMGEIYNLDFNDVVCDTHSFIETFG
jgi:protein KRI1